MKIQEKLQSKIQTLPELPGVYVFKDRNGKTLYVGKANALKKRIKAHFQRPGEARLKIMMSKVSDIEYFITQNETEALILEYNLIKSHRPPYNVMYCDDKSYPYLAVTVKEEWPRLFLTRRLGLDGVKYYGPYPNVRAVRRVLDSLLKMFPIRTCRSEEPGKRGKKPCLLYDIKKCSAPCIGAISSGEYRKYVNNVTSFLEGKNDELIKEFEKEMQKEASAMNFEKAAVWRDKVRAATYILSQQRAVLGFEKDIDVIGVHSADGVYVRIFTIRKGRIIGSRGYLLSTADEFSALEEALRWHYLNDHEVPEEIILPFQLEFQKGYESVLAAKRGKKVRLIVGKRNWRADLLAFAQENALQSYYWYKFQSKSSHELLSKLLEETKAVLKLRNVPMRIECFDVSSFREKSPAGSMVVFEDGKPKRSNYRKFKIRGLAKSDVRMINEIVKRRLERIEDVMDMSFAKKPDLIVVDGGKPQLGAAQNALLSSGFIEEIEVAALAKKGEKIFRPGEKLPIRLQSNSEVLKLFQRIRDESHRFAVSFHRELEGKKMTISVLDQVAGIGPARKRKLINRFGDVETLARASLVEIESVVPRRVALKLKEVLSKNCA